MMKPVWPVVWPAAASRPVDTVGRVTVAMAGVTVPLTSMVQVCASSLPAKLMVPSAAWAA